MTKDQLQERIEDLERINKQHQEINGELREQNTNLIKSRDLYIERITTALSYVENTVTLSKEELKRILKGIK